jgi:hypothetical protein
MLVFCYRSSRTAAVAKTAKKSRAATRPLAPHKARRIEARRAAGASAANIARADKVTIRCVRQIIAGMSAKREVARPAGFVPLQTARLGGAMVVARAMMTEDDLRAMESRRPPLLALFLDSSRYRRALARERNGLRTKPNRRPR